MSVAGPCSEYIVAIVVCLCLITDQISKEDVNPLPPGVELFYTKSNNPGGFCCVARYGTPDVFLRLKKYILDHRRKPE